MSAGPEARVGRLDWEALARALDDDGVAVTPPLLSRVACRRLRERFDDERTAFRSTIDMSRHNYGSGMYRYFDYPLPPEVQALREAFYPPLAAIANAWAERMRSVERWPATLAELTAPCQADGQKRPTPLPLRCGEGE